MSDTTRRDPVAVQIGSLTGSGPSFRCIAKRINDRDVMLQTPIRPIPAAGDLVWVDFVDSENLRQIDGEVVSCDANDGSFAVRLTNVDATSRLFLDGIAAKLGDADPFDGESATDYNLTRSSPNGGRTMVSGKRASGRRRRADTAVLSDRELAQLVQATAGDTRKPGEEEEFADSRHSYSDIGEALAAALDKKD